MLQVSLPLDQGPERAREHNRDHIAPYNRVLLELAVEEARYARWRSGFYEVQDGTSKAASNILGEASIAPEGDETQPI
jgi:hypothetical protein